MGLSEGNSFFFLGFSGVKSEYTAEELDLTKFFELLAWTTTELMLDAALHKMTEGETSLGVGRGCTQWICVPLGTVDPQRTDGAPTEHKSWHGKHVTHSPVVALTTFITWSVQSFSGHSDSTRPTNTCPHEEMNTTVRFNYKAIKKHKTAVL